MNTPPNNAVPLTQTVQLPEPGFPMLTRMISNPLFPPDEPTPSDPSRPTKEAEPVTWIVGSPHPLVPDMKIMRMFVDRGGVEVYSISADGRSGTRNMLPMNTVRIIEEAMPLDVFVQELAAAEDDGEDEPDDPEEPEEPGDPTTPAEPASTNGQSTTQPS